MCAYGRLYVLSGSLSLLCAIKFVFASSLRLDVTGRLEPEEYPPALFIYTIYFFSPCSVVSSCA